MPSAAKAITLKLEQRMAITSPRTVFEIKGLMRIISKTQSIAFN